MPPEEPPVRPRPERLPLVFDLVARLRDAVDADLRAVPPLPALAERLEAPPAELARLPPDLAALERVPEPLARDFDDFETVDRLLLLPLRPLLEEEPPDDPSSSVHLPDITRCAASVTASAINAPRRLALDMTLVAADCAESAASSPASRILRRAPGLAAIAAAAAVRPAASISRLIATFAILSTALSLLLLDDRLEPDELPPLEELLLEEPFFEAPLRLVDFAIANLLISSAKDTSEA